MVVDIDKKESDIPAGRHFIIARAEAKSGRFIAELTLNEAETDQSGPSQNRMLDMDRQPSLYGWSGHLKIKQRSLERLGARRWEQSNYKVRAP